MADVGSLVKKYLDPSRASKRWSLYSVLGIEELLDDRTMIAVAVDAAINQLKAADRTTDPESFEQIVKIVRQARATLLDDEKKAAYDKQLKALLQKVNSGPSEQTPSRSDLVRLQSVLPSGDPTAPFSMSEYLQQPSVELQQETAAERLFAVMELARQSVAPAPVVASVKPNGTALPPPTNGLPGAARGGSNAASKQLQAQIRRNRERKNMIASSVVLGVATVFIGASVWYYFNNRPPASETLANNQRPGFVDGSAGNQSTGMETNTGDASSPGKKRMNLGVASSDQAGPVGELPKMSFGTETDMPRPAGDNPETNPAPSNAAADMPMASMATADKPTMEKPPVAAPMVEAPPAPPTPDQLKKWSEAMNAARDAMVSRDFSQFHSNIEKALALPHDDAQADKLKRLDFFGQLFEKGMNILKQELAKRKGGEELSIGSTIKLAVIESKEQELIVREAGKNKTYKHDELPMGIVMGLVNLDLTDAPIDEAIRGTLYLIAPQSKAPTKGQAFKFFEKAAQADPKFVGLDTVMKDTY